MMRQPLRPRPRLAQTATVFPLPAPTGGWNVRDNLAAMPELDAIEMINFFPEVDGVTLRRGDVLFASGLSGEVEFLFEYASPTTNDLLAASDGNVYDITAGGTISSTIGTGFTNAQWQAVNYLAQAFLVNGDDAPQDWDGSTLSATSWTGAIGSINDLINVNQVRNRLWFTEKDAARAWYAGIGSISGTLTLFDIGEFAREGFLMQVSSWSRDAGAGMDDFTVFTMSTGEALVYTGDPAGTVANENAFTLIGRYMAPEPIGRRCTVNWGGELIVITRGGYLPMTGIMNGKVRPEDAISGKIRDAVSKAAENGSALNGWVGILHPDGTKLIFNVPSVDKVAYDQHVINTITGSWGKREGRNHRSIATLNNEMYGGFNTFVFRLDEGGVDQSRPELSWNNITEPWEAWGSRWEDDASPISSFVQQAFNGLDRPGNNLPGFTKRVTNIKPFVRGSGVISLTAGVRADFDLTRLPDNQQVLSPDAVFWEDIDTNWEVFTEPWGSGDVIIGINLTAGATGETFSVLMQANTTESLIWYNTTLKFQQGGING